MYRYRTGIPWRDQPAEFGPWQTAWKRHHRFCLDGTWDQILTAVLTDADAAGAIDWRVSVDSSSVRAAPAQAQRMPAAPSDEFQAAALPGERR